MQTCNTSNLNPSVCALILGASGVGKTFLASTLPGKTIIISCEAGLLSLRGASIDYIAIEGSDLERWEKFRQAVSYAANSDYDNIYIDSLTEISDFIYAHCESEFREDRYTQQRWGLYSATLKKLVKFLRDIPKNVFLTSLLKQDKDDLGRRFYAPDISGRMVDRLPGYFDLVLCLKILDKGEEKVRYVQTFSDSSIATKDRSGTLNRFEVPNLKLILEKIKGGKKNAKAKVEKGDCDPDRERSQPVKKSLQQVQGDKKLATKGDLD